MGKRMLRGFWLRRERRERSRRHRFLLSAALGLALALLLIHCLDAALRPQLVALSEAQVQNQVTHIAEQAVSQALADQALSYTDMVHLPSDQGGRMTALSTDTIRLTTLRTAILEDIIAQVEQLDSHSLGVPLGALTGLDLLSSKGPDLPVRVLSVASAEGRYHNDFTSAGINQTLHRITLDVTIAAKLLLPGGIVETTVYTPVCVAETILVGEVPQTYLQLPAE